MDKNLTWTDKAKFSFEQAMEQFRGKRYNCDLCGQEGEYGKDLESLIVNIGEWGILEGNKYTATVSATFACKDIKACYQRQKSKKK